MPSPVADMMTLAVRASFGSPMPPWLDAETAWTLPAILALALLYCAGAARLLHRARAGRAATLARALAFLAGIAILLAATTGPLHDAGQWSLAAHMGQHMLLVALVPPLLLLGRPGVTMAQALPSHRGRHAHRAWRGIGDRLARALVPAAAVQMAVIGFWHHPGAMTATLFDLRLHALMHASFLISGLWLWQALLWRIREPRAGIVPALVVIVAMMMQMGLLGALLTFSARLLYPVCSARAAAHGLDALGDQQLAGLIMWVPACLPYLIGGLWLLYRGFGRAGRGN